jgi:site-specific DNA recombinase
MRCIVYSRFSSSNQREESIHAQRRACQEYAQRQRYTILREFADEARSATTDDRPQFLDMVGQITRGTLKADVVLVHKLDRFARNRYDAAFYRRELRKAGCRLESVLERLDDSPESVILESVLEGYAEFYSLNLSREVMKGMKETALQGKHNGGRPPLGYRVTADKHYEIDEETSPIIREIFTRAAAGESYPQIVAALHQAGYRTRDGNLFKENSLHDILKNKKYIGIYIFNRTEAKGPDGKRRHRKSKNPTEIIEIPGALPAIIDPDTWAAVQARMTKNKHQAERARGRAKAVYILSGLITCESCGRKMVGSSKSYHTRVGKEYRQRHVYQCPTKGCSQPELEKSAAEHAVVEEMRRKVFTADAMKEISRLAMEYAKFRRKDRKGEGSHLQSELRKLESKIQNLVQAIAAGGQLSALVEELQRLEKLKTTLIERLRQWELLQQMDPTEQGLLHQLRLLRARVTGDNPEDQKAIAQEFITSIIAAGTKLTVAFSLPLGDGGCYEWRRAVTVSTHRHVSNVKSAPFQ